MLKRSSRLAIAVAVIYWAMLAGPAVAEEDDTASAGGGVSAFIKSDKAKAAKAEAATTEPVFELPEAKALQALGELDADMRDAAVASIREYYRYRESGYKHRRAVFDWQLQSSKIIFWVVIVLVAVSIYFSGVQFHAALRPRPASKKTKGEQTGDEPVPASPAAGLETSIEASSSGIKVNSSVLGVIILVISLLFFYLYLVHIYPISEIW